MEKSLTNKTKPPAEGWPVLHIYHKLLYRYDEPVLLGPQRLNLWPRLGEHQRLLSHRLSITPSPSGLYSELDVEGNNSQWAYFNGPTRQLEVVMEMKAECHPFNPLHFVVYPFDAATMPFEYSGPLARLLERYKAAAPPDKPVAQWAASLLEEASHQTVAFLELLCRRLHDEFTYTLRKDGPPHNPADTFLHRRGSCRDLSMLMIAVCHSVGLAARFVSGYAWTERELEKNELHAWVEVYLPGAGWRAFDPTQGTPVTARHITMAASAFQDRTVPVYGTYGGPAPSRLDTEVRLKMA
ncbi:MAG: transglutaminase family protein [Phaeodactylibacter sp.]|nr:transglutaminase family protein [Phaeodactylibacter sp.]MCB9275006.1 transglutaminase family protein [Lewinellaceae bacterium]